jgi:hypothetical protein
MSDFLLEERLSTYLKMLPHSLLAAAFIVTCRKTESVLLSRIVYAYKMSQPADIGFARLLTLLSMRMLGGNCPSAK